MTPIERRPERRPGAAESFGGDDTRVTEWTDQPATYTSRLSTQRGGEASVLQPMPDLTPEQYDALRVDIAAHGILVPVVVDQHGRVLDGHNRRRIADELGVECPTVVQQVADDSEALDLAVALNCARRHLTREQVREVIAAEIARRPDDSDRAIARRVGCDHKTVAAVRRGGPSGEIPHRPAPWQPPADVDLDLKAAVLSVYDELSLPAELPGTDEEAKRCRIAMLYDADTDELALAVLLATEVDPLDLAGAVIGRMGMWKARGMDRALIRQLFEPWIDVALSPSQRAASRAGAAGRFMDGITDEETLDLLLSRVASVPAMGQAVAFGGAR